MCQQLEFSFCGNNMINNEIKEIVEVSLNNCREAFVKVNENLRAMRDMIGQVHGIIDYAKVAELEKIEALKKPERKKHQGVYLCELREEKKYVQTEITAMYDEYLLHPDNKPFARDLTPSDLSLIENGRFIVDDYGVIKPEEQLRIDWLKSLLESLPVNPKKLKQNAE